MAVVTGGDRGLGQACAAQLAAGGHRVAVLDLAPPGGPHLAVTADVTCRGDIDAAIEHVRRELGPPLVLVNAAGILRSTPFEDISEVEWDEVFDVSVKGTVFAIQACLASMRAAGHGRIVNFSSTAGKSVSTLGGAHYTAAKAAVLGLTRAAAKETAAQGITVNAVCPGLFETAMTREAVGPARLQEYAGSCPIRRLGRAEEVAALVAFLCSDDAGYITGAAVDINGGDLMVS